MFLVKTFLICHTSIIQIAIISFQFIVHHHIQFLVKKYCQQVKHGGYVDGYVWTNLRTNQGRTDGNVLFNDTLQNFFKVLYGIRNMVKNSKTGNPLPPHGLLFPISSKVFLYASSHRQDNTYHSLCYTSCGALAGMRNSSVG